MSPPCDRCRARPARVWATEEPEQDCAVLFGDQTAGMFLCEPCLEATEADGPWSAVERLIESRVA